MKPAQDTEKRTPSVECIVFVQPNKIFLAAPWSYLDASKGT